jgi:hypothetical protein
MGNYTSTMKYELVLGDDGKDPDIVWDGRSSFIILEDNGPVYFSQWLAGVRVYDKEKLPINKAREKWKDLLKRGWIRYVE